MPMPSIKAEEPLPELRVARRRERKVARSPASLRCPQTESELLREIDDIA
jgi:hypothetical protein